MSVTSFRDAWPALYAILDAESARRHGWTVPALGEALLSGGARMIQLRAPSATSGQLLAWCDALVDAAARRGAQVIVNDRADVARLSGAAGVHLGQRDLPVTAARALLGEGAIIGLSTHSRDEIDASMDTPVDYVAVGPIFPTTTKQTGYEVVGSGLLRYAVARVACPVVAIGGITLRRAPEVQGAGAASVAVVADLLADGDPGRRVAAYLRALSDEGSK